MTFLHGGRTAFPGGKVNNADVTDRLRLIMIRLAAIAERCEDESIRRQMRETIEQLVQVIAALSGQAEPDST
jgi:hypothetical protein